MKLNKQAEPKPVAPMGFFAFMKCREQLRDLGIFSAAFLLLGIIIHICYPHIEATGDTGGYMLSAENGLLSGVRPIGYSWFLGFFHGLSPGMGFLFASQLLLHAVASMLFLFTVKYRFPVRRVWLFYVLAALVVVEPNALALANLAMSDSVFNTLTLLFLTSLLWLNTGRSTLMNALLLAGHLLLLYLNFEVRYVALFYPLFSVLFLLLNSQKKWVGALLALLPVLVTALAYNATKAQMKKQFGKDIFSAFGGWATANNAVSIIPYIDLAPEQITDADARFIHSVVVQFPDSVFTEPQVMGTNFIWKREFPGKQALFLFIRQRPMSYGRAWVHMGDMMGKYGNLLIRKYPGLYLRHYVLPNTARAFRHYPIFGDDVYRPDAYHKQWFGLDADEYPTRYPLFKTLDPLTLVVFYLRWVLFAAALVFVALRFRRFTVPQRQVLLGLVAFTLLYLAFSVVSHPINNYRYLIPLYVPMWFLAYAALGRFLEDRQQERKM